MKRQLRRLTIGKFTSQPLLLIYQNATTIPMDVFTMLKQMSGFQVCSTSGWEVIEISGANGSIGLTGDQGSAGADGANGTDGQIGVAGTDGISTLIRALSSTSCTTGGNTFEIGSDSNSDGVLDVSEVGMTVDICNGSQGPEGPPGTAGTNGTNGTNGTDGQDGANGADGVGTDGMNGTNGTNGINGTDGQDGANGADGVGTDGMNGTNGTNGTNALNALVTSTSEPAGNNCANGGTRIDVGVDDNADGVLDTTEIDQTQYVCNGGSSNNTMLTSISSPLSNMGCDAGGRTVSYGFDNGDGGGTSANGVLEPGEVDASTTLCSRYSTVLFRDINTGSGNGYFESGFGQNNCELAH